MLAMIGLYFWLFKDGHLLDVEVYCVKVHMEEYHVDKIIYLIFQNVLKAGQYLSQVNNYTSILHLSH